MRSGSLLGELYELCEHARTRVQPKASALSCGAGELCACRPLNSRIALAALLGQASEVSALGSTVVVAPRSDTGRDASCFWRPIQVGRDSR